MAQPTLIYAFEGIGTDLPRPPMAALRALLSAGVLVSARAWQELPPDTRLAITRAGAAERIDEPELSTLLKQVPVSQVKFIGRRAEPDAATVPPDLAAALGPVRPLTLAEWTGLRAVDRYVLVSLVKNSRLLAKALNELLPQTGGAVNAGGVVVAWSGLAARCEIRMRRETAQKVLSSEFMGGRAFVLANVAGRRAARRASELLDLQAESTVGPVEVDWGFRAADDVLFWQAHVSAWDGTFFPVAAMLAATTAANAMYDMVRVHDPTASLIYAGVREEPWQAGRDHLIEPATALFTRPSAAPAEMNETVRMDAQDTRLNDSGGRPSAAALAELQRLVPPAPTSNPVLAPVQAVSRVPPSSDRSASAGRRSTRPAPVRPAWVGVAVVGVIILANLVVLLGILTFLRGHHR